MESDRFDAWTRRRFGLGIGAGGVLAGLLSLAAATPADAGKQAKRRKRRLKKNDGCTQGGKRTCCKDLRCGFPAALSMTTHCRARAEGKCDEDFDCCEGLTCDLGRGRCEPLDMR